MRIGWFDIGRCLIRVLFRSQPDGGRRLVVVAQLVRDGVRPITAWEEE